MDRNNITGLLLIGLLILGWAYFFFPSSQPSGAGTQVQERASGKAQDTLRASIAPDSGSEATRPIASPALENDSLVLADRFGAFAPAAEGRERLLPIATEDLQITLSTHGAQLVSVVLPGHKDYRDAPLELFSAAGGSYQDLVFGHQNRIIHSRELYYVPSDTQAIALNGEQVRQVRLRATLAAGKYLEHIYTFRGQGYEVGYQLVVVGLEDVLRGSFMDMETQVGFPRMEANQTEELRRTQVFYRVDGEVESLDVATDEPESAARILSAEWVSFKTMFFLAALLPEVPFQDVSLRAEPKVVDRQALPGEPLQHLSSAVRLQLRSTARDSVGFTWYLGPTDRTLLAAYKVGLAEQLKLGWGPVGWINKGIIVPLFGFLESYTRNYGIIILLLAIFIKLLLSPLTYRSYVSNAKMQVVNNMPEVKELDEKYKDDPTKLQQMKLQFYGQIGVSPLAGCLPLLLQMPVFFAMFTFFPQSIELRHQPFLWAEDLSSYDSLLRFGFRVPLLGDHLSGFALLMTLSQLAYTYVTQQSQTFTGPMASMKYMGYIFPFVFFFVLNDYSAGLSWYYLVINVLTILQTYAIKATINQEKLHNKIVAAREKRAKSGKPAGGGLAGWLEKQQKQQQQTIRERNNERFAQMQKKAKPRKR